MNSNDFKKLMWLEACELITEAERLHRQFFQPGEPWEDACTWEPPADIIESDGRLVILVALPGVKEDDVEVFTEQGTLVVIGRRSFPQLPADARFQRLEIPYGQFCRRVSLPAGEYDVESNQMMNGCLQLILHKVNR